MPFYHGMGFIPDCGVLALTNLYPNPFQPHRAIFNRQQLRALADRHSVAGHLPRSPGPTSSPLGGRAADPSREPAGRAGRDRRRASAVHVSPRAVMRGWYGHFYLDRSARPSSGSLAEFRPDLFFAPWAYPDGWAAVELGHGRACPSW